MENKWNQLKSNEVIDKTVNALKVNGMNAMVVEGGNEAKEKVLQILPDGAEVMTMTSVTLDIVGLSKYIQNSSKHVSVRNQMMSLDPEKERKEMKKIGAVHDYVIGSVHAVTEEGQVLVASATGSQIPAYAYGANHVIWVVGTQKIVPDIAQGIKRIYDFVLPLESERAKKAFGAPGSVVAKLLIVNKEVTLGRITIIFVKEKLGF